MEGLHLALDLLASNALVEADPVRMQQVLWNIFRNAVKFTLNGGDIHIRSKLLAGKLVLTCTDTGIGIDSEALPRIFTAFEQADSEISQRFGGLGLGLAIASGLVGKHGGRITAASDGRHRGATFTRVLAAVDAVRAMRTASVAAPGRVHPSEDVCRLLLVEDNVDAASAMVLSLEAYGYRVTHALTQASALAMIGARSFDIVVTDLGLPDGSGIEVGRALRGLVPVIALSGYGTARDVEQSISAGFAGHLIKPVDPEIMHAMIQRVLSQHRDIS